MSLVEKQGTILVTGGSGFMGSAFIRFLLGNPEFLGKVINLDATTYAVHPHSLRCIENSPRYRFFSGSITNPSLLEQIFTEQEIHAVVHFAAETHVDRSIHSPLPFIDTNIQGTFHLLEQVRKYGPIHFHHISTDEVYGSLGESGTFSEHSPYRPNSPYAASKAAADHLVRSYACTYGISTTISHAANNYGPYQYPEKFVPLMIRNCLQKRPLPIYGTGHQVRDWLFVEDHAKAIWVILQKGKKNEVYNVGGKRELSNLAFLEVLFEMLSLQTDLPKDTWKGQVQFVKDRLGHDFRYSLNTQKVEEELGFIPETSLEEGLAKTVRWYQKQLRRKTLQKVVS